MPRHSRNTPPPKMRNKGARSVVTLTDRTTGRRRDYQLGPSGTREAAEAYARVVGAWETAGRRLPSTETAASISVAEVFVLWLREKKSGTAPANHSQLSRWCLELAELCGSLPACTLGPRRLREVRDIMAADHGTYSANKAVRAAVSAFRWASCEELIPADRWQALAALSPIKRHTVPSAPADPAHVRACYPYMSKAMRDVCELILLTGARPSEILRLRVRDIDTTSEVWTATLEHHKTEHRGRPRKLWFGQKSQAILAPRMSLKPDAAIFPTDGASGVPLQSSLYSEVKRAQARLAEKTGLVVSWHPYQLRKTSATAIRAEFGLEASAVILGHSSAEITDAIYAARDEQRAVEVMKKIG